MLRTSLFTPKRHPSAAARRPPSELVERESSVWDPTAMAESPVRPIIPCATLAHDAELIAILEAPLQRGETVVAGFARKERELAVAFAGLGIQEARALHHRLATPRSGDVLAESFTHLTVERRNRLLGFLANARRRAAIAAARR